MTHATPADGHDPLRLDPDLVARSPVFAGIPPDAFPELLVALGATVRRFADGDAVCRTGESMAFFPVVLAGGVRATLFQEEENRAVASFGPGASFAEAVAASVGFCPVDVWAEGPTTVLCLPAASFSDCPDPRAATLHANIMQQMSLKVMTLARNIAVLGEPRLQQRIVAYLNTLPHDEDGYATLPFTQREWASYLRVDEKTLSRKLKEMRADGLIELDRRRARVLPPNNPQKGA